ncbi:PREDICTED: uncharacterized protein LOC104588612 [Nelumbo nucifera]|uniref:RING-type E3 ubiquitin transferase n=1 Tax=Nelumbo nucifera TaxID=4432 RepID=A0A1U7Z2P2_NELNU|nr:PREDICTED: uncharacterized protein LOC104588612 [Nelumbo nucifera]
MNMCGLDFIIKFKFKTDNQQSQANQSHKVVDGLLLAVPRILHQPSPQMPPRKNPPKRFRRGRIEESSNIPSCSHGNNCESSEQKKFEVVPDQPLGGILSSFRGNDGLTLLYVEPDKAFTIYTWSSLIGRSLIVDQTSDIPNTSSQQENSGNILNYEQNMLSVRSCSENSSMVIISSNAVSIYRRERISLSKAHSRRLTEGTLEVSHLTLSNIIKHIGSIFSGSHFVSNSGIRLPPSSFNYIICHHVSLSRIPRGPSVVVQTPLLADTGYDSQSRNTPPLQYGQAASSTDEEVGLQNDVDLLTQRYVQSVVFMHRLANDLLEASALLRRITASGHRQFMLSSEDTLLLSQSPLFDIENLHDHYGDMRLDVDNMSYEELLALEEHIGNVNTGLSEEAIMNHLKKSRYIKFSEIDGPKEACSICQEEYTGEDELGNLECGHDFHTTCITQWLRCKNLCPIAC